MNFKFSIKTLFFLLLLIFTFLFSQEVVKYQITDDGTELDIGTAVKVDAAGNITACGDNDPDVIGIITAKEVSGGTRYYLVGSSDIALAPLPDTVSVGDKLTTAASGGLRTATGGEIVVAIALENGDGNALTLEKIMITLGFASGGYFIENQIFSAQSADFWLDDTGRVGYLVADSGAVINESGGNYDFRVEGDTDPNLLFADASSDNIGIGTNTPNQDLSIAGSMGIIEGGTFPNYYSIFYGSDQTADIAYYLPPAQGATNTFLMNDGSGNLLWSRPTPEVVTILAGYNIQWRNMPADLTELFNATQHRTMVDLTNATQVRLTVAVGTAGSDSAELRGQYSTDESNWYYLDGASGPGVPINAVGLQVSSWVNLVADAKTDVYIRIIGINGDGRTDPKFGLITLQFK